MLHTYFSLLLPCEWTRPLVVKRLQETNHNHLLLLCHSPVFSEQFDLNRNCALARARLNKRWVRACKQALVFGPAPGATKQREDANSHAKAKSKKAVLQLET